MSVALDYIIKKFNLDLAETQPIQLKDIGRNGLAEVFAKLGFNKGIEIGVDRGAFSKILCRANPKLHLTSIDSWSTHSFEDPLNSSKTMQIHFENHYQSAVKRLSKYNCDILREDSLTAVKRFTDNSLDFVYIDANHNFAQIAQDLCVWTKKVRPGGIVSGHDYMHFPPSKDNHVKHVVDAYVRAFEINPYFELGIDRYHSWFWIK